MSWNIGKSISKNVNGKISQKLPDNAKKSVTDKLKTDSKRVIQKTNAPARDLIGNKTANKIARSPKNFSRKKFGGSWKRNRKYIGFNREIPKERYVSPEKWQKIMDYLRLM